MGELTASRSPAQLMRFGLFELDLGRRSLRKSGVRIRLQKQPLEVLGILLERPGEIVGREELRIRLWPELRPADFDHRLNKAINKVRVALADSADNPRFVETVARQGYRFIAPVDIAEPAGVAATSAAGSSAESAGESSRWRWMSGAAVAGALALVMAVHFLSGSPEAPAVEGYHQLTDDGHQKLDGLSTDGERIYFVEFHDGETHLASVPLDGGRPTYHLTPFAAGLGVFVLDVSGDGRELLLKTSTGLSVDEAGPLWVYSLENSAARRLGDLVVTGAQWSPDGTKLAYFVGQDLFVAETDGSGARKAASKPGANSGIEWSPNGQSVRFRSAYPSAEHNTLWEAALDTGEVRQLFPDWGFEQNTGVWTSGSAYFLFYSPSDYNLWVSRENTSYFSNGNKEPIQLTRGPLRLRSPRVTPDGRSLVAIGEMLRGELHRWAAPVGQFLPYLGGLSADQLDFSRDGCIAYVSFPRNNLWVADADGLNRRQLTKAPLRVYLPRFSPDGSRIAFMGRQPGGRWKIRLVPVSGGESRILMPGDGTEADPNWSPDGRKLVYAPLPWELSQGEESGVFLYDFDTGESSRLPGSEGKYSPRWSPDGRYIAVINNRRSFDLYDLETRKWSRLTDMQGGFPAWSRDSRHLYFFHEYTRERGIYRTEVSSGKTEKAASLQDVEITGTLGPFGLSLGPDDTPIILRDRGIQEIFELDLNLP